MEFLKIMILVAAIISGADMSSYTAVKNGITISVKSFTAEQNTSLVVSKEKQLKILNVSSLEKCQQKCHLLAQCQSFDVGPPVKNKTVECHLLATNKYISSIERKPGWTHASLKNEGCEKKPCKNKRACLPNYSNNTFVCLCGESYYGEYCQYKGPVKRVFGGVSMSDSSASPKYSSARPAHLAQDGNTNQKYYLGSCAVAVGVITQVVWWRADLPHLYLIHSVEIYTESWLSEFARHNSIAVGNNREAPETNPLCSQAPDGNHFTACQNDQLEGRVVLVFHRFTDAANIYHEAVSLCEVIIMGVQLLDC